MNFKFLLNSFHWTQSMHLTLPQVSAFQKSCWKSPPAWRELRLQPAKGRHALAWELTMYRPVYPLKLFLIVGASSLLWHHLGANFHSTIQDCIFPLPRTPEPHCYHLLPSQRRNRKEGKWKNHAAFKRTLHFRFRAGASLNACFQWIGFNSPPSKGLNHPMGQLQYFSDLEWSIRRLLLLRHPWSWPDSILSESRCLRKSAPLSCNPRKSGDEDCPWWKTEMRCKSKWENQKWQKNLNNIEQPITTTSNTKQLSK